jgi:hypothetical protein
MTLPLAGAADLEPCAVEGAVEVAMVEMCRCSLKSKARCRDKRMSPCVFYGVIECWRGFVREKRVGMEAWEWVDIYNGISIFLESRCEGILW